MNNITTINDHYSLRTICNNSLKDFSFPEGDFNPDGNWTSSYKVMTLTGQGWPLGKLKIKRICKENGRINLVMHYQLFLKGGYRQDITGQIECVNNSLSSPAFWKFNSLILTPSKQPQPFTKQTKTAKISNGKMQIVSSGKKSIKIPNENYTTNWLLFDAVQRLPKDQTTPITFAMLDHFDQIKKDQKLTFRTNTVIKYKDKDHQLYAYQQVGTAVTPVVYWVNNQGRLLFVISGFEAYILENDE